MIEKFKPQHVGIPRSLGGGILAVQSSYDRRLLTACDVPRCTAIATTFCQHPACRLKVCDFHARTVGGKVLCPPHRRRAESGGGR